MTKNEFKQMTASGLVFLDGATGSNLMKKGMPAGVCPEQWILDHPEAILSLQRAYVEAGSQIIYAPTFTGNRIKLAEYGLENKLEEINRGLVRLSRQAAGKKALVAGDICMTGRQLKPVGDMELEALIAVYKEQILCLAGAGVDLLVVETIMSLREARAALIAAKETCDLPVMVSLTFESGGRTLFGTDGATAAVVLESLGASAVGMNCSAGPNQLLPIVECMARVTSLPIIAKPNAGLPSLNQQGETVYDMEEDAFVFHMKDLIRAGASMIGGCCGTSPAYIEKLSAECNDMIPPKRQMTEFRHLSSERATLSFGLDDGFIMVGERINPTGKKKLQEELRGGHLDMVLQFAEEQENCGAAVLDVNMGMSGIDEKEMMLRALNEIGLATSLPLSIDSSQVETIEAALRQYPGRALINSISCEQVKFDELLPIAARYGAMFILLPLSDAGLPKDMEEKKAIIEKIATRALELGMRKEDIVVDALVTTVGANPKAALEALETIRYCKEQGYATTCGLSNISFGLPERIHVNAAFLAMAIQEGLTMAILNPSQELLAGSVLASDLLLGREQADIRYIEQISRYKVERESAAALRPVEVKSADSSKEGNRSQENKTQDNGIQDNMSPTVSDRANLVWEAVVKGNRSQIKDLVQSALEEGIAARELLNGYLLPAINEVGALFDKGKYFLPQLINGAEAMKLAIDYLEPLLVQSPGKEQAACVVIATVKGDIHDIGKNLVVLMLKNYGYRVIDLGKDVSREEIVAQALAHQADIIALSALMTTTMTEMKHVLELIREKGLAGKVVIGGAVITQEYADEIGADGYAKDAADTVKVVGNLLS